MLLAILLPAKGEASKIKIALIFIWKGKYPVPAVNGSGRFRIRVPLCGIRAAGWRPEGLPG
jgi:hypothetical protein